MWLPESPATMTAVLAVPVALTAGGIGVAIQNLRRGGLRDAMVRILLSSRRTRQFMASIGGITCALTLFGTSEAIEPFFPRYFGALEYLPFGAFLAGSAASLLLILVQFDYNPLHREEQLDLRDREPQVLAAIGAPALPLDEDPNVRMYVAQAPSERPPTKSLVGSMQGFLDAADASRV